MSDTFTVNLSTVPVVYDVDLNTSPQVFDVVVRQALDGTDGTDGITPIIIDALSGLDVSTDNGQTYSPLVSYQDIIDAATIDPSDINGLVDALSAKANLDGPVTFTGNGSQTLEIGDFVYIRDTALDNILFSTEEFILRDINGDNSVAWSDRNLYDSSNYQSVQWESRDLIDSFGNVSLNWNDSGLLYVAGDIQFSGVASLNTALNSKLDSAVIRGLSSNWQNSYTSLQNLSSNWQNTFTTIGNLSSNWQNSYTSLQNLSSNWQTAYTTLSTKANLSGGNVFFNNQNISGNLSANGNTYINALSCGAIVSRSSSSVPLWLYTTTNNSCKLESASTDAQFQFVTSGGLKSMIGHTSNTVDGFRIYNFGTSREELFIPYATGNLGLGTTNPNEKLTVVGNISATGNFTCGSITSAGIQASQEIFSSVGFKGVYYQGQGGSATAPSYTFYGAVDTNTGMFRAAEDTLGFTTGGVERLRITPTGSLSSNGSTYTNGLTSIGNVTSTNQNPISSLGPNDLLTLALLRQINGLGYNQVILQTTSGWTKTSTGVGSSIVSQNPIGICLQAGSVSVSGSCIAYVVLGAETAWSIGSFGGSGYGGIDFTKEIEINFHIGVQFAYLPGFQRWAVILSDQSPTNPLSSMLPTSSANYVAVCSLSGGLITLQGLKSGSAKQISPTLSIQPAGASQTSYRLIISGGTAYLYTGLTFLGSIDTMPNTQIATNGYKFFIMTDCDGVTGQVVQPVVNFSNMSIRWY